MLEGEGLGIGIGGNRGVYPFYNQLSSMSYSLKRRISKLTLQHQCYDFDNNSSRDTRNFLQKSSSKSLPIVASCQKRHYSNVKDFQKSVYYVLYEVIANGFKIVRVFIRKVPKKKDLINYRFCL